MLTTERKRLEGAEEDLRVLQIFTILGLVLVPPAAAVAHLTLSGKPGAWGILGVYFAGLAALGYRYWRRQIHSRYHMEAAAVGERSATAVGNSGAMPS